jgi:peptidoglycan hydrolase FlgJ
MMPVALFGWVTSPLAINPASDIVLGSMLAADPDKYRAAAEKLRRLAAAAADRAASPAPPIRTQAALSSAAATIPQQRLAGDAFGRLEAFVLQTFIQSMLPANAETVFGKGTAGEVWKSMLAEQLANQMALSGQLGLAKRLAQGMPGTPAAAGAGAAVEPPPARPPAAASLLLVLPFLQQDLADTPPSEELKSSLK